uniref:Uncharacterized protein n=1 Tax=Timema cristinae TaxID=61476 RepID=A0A7R9CLL5_TIMCR|nr:unnamed protein product [Timema cristinae]
MQDRFSLATGLVAQDDVSCYKAVSVGEQSLQRIGTDITQFGSQAERAGVAKTMSSSTSTRILCTVHSPDDLKDCFAFELATVLVALFDSSGLMRKIKKAAFYNSDQLVALTTSTFFLMKALLFIAYYGHSKGPLVMFTPPTHLTSRSITVIKFDRCADTLGLTVSRFGNTDNDC